MDNVSNFVERLGDLMLEKGVTPGELSKAAGVDVSMIYKYLRKLNLPSAATAIALADYFGCSLDFLLGLSDDSRPPLNPNAACFVERFSCLLEGKGCSRYRYVKLNPVAAQTVDDWFHGKRVPSLDNLIAIARFFECSVDYLLGRD